MRCKVLNTCKMVQPCWQKHQEEQHHRRTCKGWTLYRPATMWHWSLWWESEWLRWWSIFVNMMMLSLEIIFTVCRLNMQVVWRRSVCIALNLEGLLLLLIIYLSFGIESNTSFFSITPESLLLRLKSHLRRRIEKSVSVKQSRFIVKQPETTCTNGDNLEKGNIDGDEHINVKCGNLFGSSLLGYE